MKNELKNVEEDYLWDQTGEPDPELKELERVMGSLGYQPRPLALPASCENQAARNFRPLLAIAATIVLAVGAAALWLEFKRESAQVAKTDAKTAASVDSDRAAATIPDDVLGDALGAGGSDIRDDRDGLTGLVHDNHPKPSGLIAARRTRPSQAGGVEATRRKSAAGPTAPVLAANELRAAEAGKAQLMQALRVASAKFNVALRKAQGANNRNLIHNQHKIG